jgi:proteasome inhibitor subunit 1 (PI31)
MTSVLDPSAVISLLPTLLPLSSKKLASPQDGIAALLHTALSAVGFRLIAVDESASANPVLGNVLPSEWNQHGPGNYTFRYRHDQSSLEFVVKVAKLGSRTLINAIAVEVRITTLAPKSALLTCFPRATKPLL